MTIYIKDMVCVRCKMAVQHVLEGLNIGYESIELGQVKLLGNPKPEQLTRINEGLKKYELELMENKKKILVERIKTVIIEMLNASFLESRLKFSEYLSKRLQYDYTYMSNSFSEEEGSTIERFYIEYRVERIKQLIVYEKLSVKEIADQLNFSNVSHLCQQFKKLTGLTPSMFKKLTEKPDFVWKNV
jgi:AraC-like DNA-binding protein